MKQVVIRKIDKEEIDSIYCDKCGNFIGKGFCVAGGELMLNISYGSKYDSLRIRDIDICDDCFTDFLNGLINNPIKNEKDTYNDE